MKNLVWKKWKELIKNPVKLILCLVFPFILVFVYYFIFHVNYEVLFIISPLVVTVFSTYLFFAVDEIAYSIFYIALGIRPHTVWKTNILFIIIWEYLLTNLALLFLTFIVSPTFTANMVLLNIGNTLVSMALIGLSTIHFIDSGTLATIIASIFSLINLLMIAVPPLIYYLKSYKIFNTIIIAVSAVVLCICNYMMKNANCEKLIINTQEYIYGYDTKFFDEE